jgi:AcrR family transcriptional regulator
MKKPSLPPVSQKTRSRIIAAAKRTFATWGFEPASMSRIAQLATIDKSSLYYFFKNKEDLFATVTHDTWKDLSNSVEKNLSPGGKQSPQKTLSLTCQNFIKISLAAGMSTTRMELPKKESPHFTEILKNIHKTQNLALQFLKKNEVQNPELAQSVISNCIHSYVLHNCTGKKQPSIKKYCDYLASLFINH